MRIEVLYFEGCPSYERVAARLRELLASSGADAEVALVRVDGTADAVRRRFIGSPTVRVDGVDVDPGARGRTDFGLQCRLFATRDGLRPEPPDEWIVAALQRR